MKQLFTTLVFRLEFGTVADPRPTSGDGSKTPSQVVQTNDIIAMMSPDGETVPLGKVFTIQL